MYFIASRLASGVRPVLIASMIMSLLRSPPRAVSLRICLSALLAHPFSPFAQRSKSRSTRSSPPMRIILTQSTSCICSIGRLKLMWKPVSPSDPVQARLRLAHANTFSRYSTLRLKGIGGVVSSTPPSVSSCGLKLPSGSKYQVSICLFLCGLLIASTLKPSWISISLNSRWNMYLRSSRVSSPFSLSYPYSGSVHTGHASSLLVFSMKPCMVSMPTSLLR